MFKYFFRHVFIKTLKKQKKGQVVLEYVLLLVIVVAVALVMLNLVKVGDPSDPSSSGSLIRYWIGIIRAIGADV